MIPKNLQFPKNPTNRLILNYLKILSCQCFLNFPNFQQSQMYQPIPNFLLIRKNLMIHHVQKNQQIRMCLQNQKILLLLKIPKFQLILKIQQYLIVLMNQQYRYFLQKLPRRYHCTCKYCYPLNYK
jgi:hypothetical protein